MSTLENQKIFLRNLESMKSIVEGREGNPLHMTDILGDVIVINLVFRPLKVKLSQQRESWNLLIGKPPFKGVKCLPWHLILFS